MGKQEIRWFYLEGKHPLIPDYPPPPPGSPFAEMGFRPGKKQVFVPKKAAYRHGEHGGWKEADTDIYLTPESVGDTVDVMEENRHIRYIVTDDPDREDPHHSFQYIVTPEGNAVILDVQGYCERLRIPDVIDGHRVGIAVLPSSEATAHLRELTTVGAVLLDMDFNKPYLQKITLSPNTVLVRRPEMIHVSRWYLSQPNGPVRLQGWDCGWKGPRGSHSSKE